MQLDVHNYLGPREDKEPPKISSHVEQNFNVSMNNKNFLCAKA